MPPSSPSSSDLSDDELPLPTKKKETTITEKQIKEVVKEKPSIEKEKSIPPEKVPVSSPVTKNEIELDLSKKEILPQQVPIPQVLEGSRSELVPLYPPVAPTFSSKLSEGLQTTANWIQKNRIKAIIIVVLIAVGIYCFYLLWKEYGEVLKKKKNKTDDSNLPVEKVISDMLEGVKKRELPIDPSTLVMPSPFEEKTNYSNKNDENDSDDENDSILTTPKLINPSLSHRRSTKSLDEQSRHSIWEANDDSDQDIKEEEEGKKEKGKDKEKEKSSSSSKKKDKKSKKKKKKKKKSKEEDKKELYENSHLSSDDDETDDVTKF